MDDKNDLSAKIVKTLISYCWMFSKTLRQRKVKIDMTKITLPFLYIWMFLKNKPLKQNKTKMINFFFKNTLF